MESLLEEEPLEVIVRRNATDASLRALERRVLAGDLTAVQALARAYDRAGRGRELTAVVLHEDEPPLSVYLFEHRAGMGSLDVVAAARDAIAAAVSAIRPRRTISWQTATEVMSDEDWARYGLVHLHCNDATVERLADFEDEEDEEDEDDEIEPETTQRQAADEAYENYDFGRPVDACDGWEIGRDVWERTVFLEDPEGGDSDAVRFRVVFVPGVSEIRRLGVV